MDFSLITWINIFEHVIFTLVVVILINIYQKNGQEEFFRVLLVGFQALPGVKPLISKFLHREVTNFVSTTALAKKKNENKTMVRVRLPEKGNISENNNNIYIYPFLAHLSNFYF